MLKLGKLAPILSWKTWIGSSRLLKLTQSFSLDENQSWRLADGLVARAQLLICRWTDVPVLACDHELVVTERWSDR